MLLTGKNRTPGGARTMRVDDENPAELIRTEALSPVREIFDRDDSAAEVRSELSPERIAAVRRKAGAGAYHTMEVAAEVARRMIARGDV
jgi:hypothetical protein